MSVSHLINEGRTERGTLEKVADKFNFLGRVFWQGRTVSLENNKLIFNKKETFTSICKSVLVSIGKAPELICGFIGLPMFIIISIAYPIICAPAAFSLAIGLSLKKIALIKDPLSKEYQKRVKEALKAKEEQESLQVQIENTQTALKVKNRVLQQLNTDIASLQQEESKLKTSLFELEQKIEGL